MKLVIDIQSWSGDEAVDNLVLRRRLLKPGDHDIDGMKCTVDGEVQPGYVALVPYICGQVTP